MWVRVIVRMKELLFGTAGIPLSTEKRSTLTGIERVRELGLDVMELEFVRSINISAEKAPLVREMAKKNDVTLTCHGQYWVNLNAKEPAKQEASRKRVLDAAKIAHECGAWSICYHAAFYMKDPSNVAFENVKKELKFLVKKLQDSGNDIWLRPETAGKHTQFGTLQELIKMSQEVEQVLPVIDWGHLHAISNGNCNTTEAFRKVLEQLEKGLGREGLNNVHFHMEGIEYTEKGERRHLELENSDANYTDLTRMWKEFKLKGVVICESPNIETDALTLQKAYRA